MPITHTVIQGEYLSLIAGQFGFHDYSTIWDDPANADLKQKRGNPNVLLPGDELVIPDKTDHVESCPSDARYRFKAKIKPLKLQLVLKDFSAKPIANAKCRLDVGTDSTELVTDGDGKIAIPIPSNTRKGRLVIQSDDLPSDDNQFEISVGELDPIDTVTGQIARLNNLGYDAGKVQEPADDDAKQRLLSAIEEFQCNIGLKPVDGICGPNTQAKLKTAHGC